MKYKPLMPSITDRLKSAKPTRKVGATLCVSVMAGLLLTSETLPAAWSGIHFSAERIEIEGAEFQFVKGTLDGGGRLELEAATTSIEAWPEQIRNLTLVCPRIQAEGEMYCISGQWSLELAGIHSENEFSALNGVIDELKQTDGLVELVSSLTLETLQANVKIRSAQDETVIELAWTDQSLMPLRDLKAAPAESRWISRGSSEGQVRAVFADEDVPGFDFEFQLNDLSFDSPDGRYAGEGLQISSRGSTRISESLSATINGQLQGGELLLDDFYRNFSDAAMDFRFQPTLIDQALIINDILLSDGSVFRLEGAAEMDLDGSEKPSFTISNLELNFPGAYQRYVEPVAAVYTLDGLELTGKVSWSGEWEEGKFKSGELLVNDLTVVDLKRNRFAVTGLDARMRPGDYDFDSNLTWRGLLLGPLNIGPAELKLDSAPGTVALTRALELDVLGGQLVLDQFAIELPTRIDRVEQDFDVTLQARMQSMDMELLSGALGWPAFSGEISGVIPAVSYDEGVLSVDGEIQFDVFDGSISLTDLRVERLFGVLPSLAANIDIHDLALEQVTRTFSFGQIGGRLDGYLHDLRMLDWKPVAFDAWLGTPDRQDKTNGISRQAVNKLTTLGGGRATTALTGPFMKLFNTFSYRRLGLGCRLQNNVCELRGISEDDSSVLIMEGAGIPKIMIKAFNRSLDFQQLVAGLTAVSGDEKIRVGD